MYKITVNDTSYNLPKESLRLLAYTKMNDEYGGIVMALETEQEAIDFLEKLGIKVEELNVL